MVQKKITSVEIKRNNIIQKWEELYIRLNQISGSDLPLLEWATQTEQGFWLWSQKLYCKKNLIVQDEEFEQKREFWDIYIHQNVYGYQNMDVQGSYGNPYLWTEIREGRIQPIQIAQLSAMERFPQRWKEVNATLEATDKYLYHSEEVSSDAFRCMKCKQRKCTYAQAQLRSADEPMTILVRCLNCGHSWRC